LRLLLDRDSPKRIGGRGGGRDGGHPNGDRPVPIRGRQVVTTSEFVVLFVSLAWPL
jgi:hypothetical protein